MVTVDPCSSSRTPRSRSRRCSPPPTPGEVVLNSDRAEPVNSHSEERFHSLLLQSETVVNNADADIPEQNVRPTKPGLSPPERVQEAVGCLPARLPEPEAAAALADGPASGFRRWTVRDFHRAYSSGQTTPAMVKKVSLLLTEKHGSRKFWSSEHFGSGIEFACISQL
jgi:hypothetical protein